MEVYILDKNFQTIALVDDFESLIWRRKYFSCGEFSLYTSPDKYYELKDAMYLSKSDSNELGIIESIKLDESSFTIKGRFARSLTDRLIVYPTVMVKNKYLGKLMTEQISERLGIKIGDVVSGSIITTQQTGGSLMEWFDELTLNQGLTYDILYDYENNCLLFQMRQGRDLRQEQSENNPVIFSPDWDNLLSFVYEKSDKDYKNFCIVAGENSGANRRTVPIDLRSSGDEEIRELWVDARDLQSDGFTDDEYDMALFQRGCEKLSSYAKTECFSADVTTDNYTYREDYDLGDIVNISVPKHGIYTDFRITEIEEIYERGARSLTLTFGQGYLSINDYIKRELK